MVTLRPVIGEPEEQPKVTPYLLRRAEDLCPRRLALDFQGEYGHRDPVNRGRVRAAFIDAARTAHTLAPTVRAPWRPPPDLIPEEVAVFEQAVDWYCRLFGPLEVELHDHQLDRPNEVPDLDVRLGGWVDLTVERRDGTRELRQLDFWGRRPPADLLADWGVALALLRLGPWLRGRPVMVSWTDLLHGVRHEAALDPSAAADALVGARVVVDERLGTVTARADLDGPDHGRDCGTCAHHKGCREFPRAIVQGGSVARGSIIPGLISLTPSSVESWHRCRRSWRAQHLFFLPPSDDATPSVHGQKVHDLLRLLHQDGPCDDPGRIQDVVTAHAASDRVLAELEDHARRCPIDATPYGHELTRARLHARRPAFIGSARIDAAWIHDGILDVRDYKTGGVAYERLADDPRARLQAWVMEPVANELGLRLRIRYEHLAAEIVDDPDDWEPDADDLENVDAELRVLVSQIREEGEWRGVADPGICRFCRYRSICPDSAVPGVPIWPRVDDDPDFPEEPDQ